MQPASASSSTSITLNTAQLLNSPERSTPNLTVDLTNQYINGNHADDRDAIDMVPIANIDDEDVEDEVNVRLLDNGGNKSILITTSKLHGTTPSIGYNGNNDSTINHNDNGTEGNITNGGTGTNSFIVSLNHKLFGGKRFNGLASLNDAATNGSKNVELVWRNLSYDISTFKWNKFIRNPCSMKNGFKRNRLLDSISGSIRSGELVAIMGPSGAGKTTLIECISGRRSLGVSGEIIVSGGNKRTKLAYNAQDDSLMPCLTVYETLLFASKLRNYQRNNRLKVKLVEDNENVYNATTYPDSNLIISLTNEAYHRNLVNSIIHKLGLDSCQNVRAENCSGGQQKRLSIALELIHSPTILILDEPTSGLDSVSCLQCVTLLRDLAHNPEQPMAIAASIHQPTARILQNFDRLYVIAVNGQCLYDGPTDQLVTYLARYNLTCPTYHNPADFVVEIASTDYGTEVTKQLVEIQRMRHQQNGYGCVQNNNNNNNSIAPPKYEQISSNIDETIKETTIMMDEDKNDMEKNNNNNLSIDNSLIKSENDFEFEMTRLWTDENSSDTVSIGKICKSSRKQVKRRELFKTGILWGRCLRLSFRDPTEYLLRSFACVAIIILNVILYYESDIGKADGCSQDSLLHLVENLKSDYSANKSFSMTNTLLEGPGALAILNFGFVFFAILFVSFLSMMPVILTFPMEVGVFYKEYFNGWYSFSSYFIAKNLTNLLPTILVPIIFGASAYLITGQIWEPWRFFYFIFILVLIALVADGVGIAISALFVHNVNAASIFAAIAQIPMLLFTGLLVQINTLPYFIRPLTYLSYYRLCFESALIILYGYGRCKPPKPFDMKEVRRLIGDDVEEVIDCVGQHVSFFEDDSSDMFGRFDRIMQSVDNANPSLIMRNFNLNDEDLYFVISLLIVYAIVARIVAYIVLYRKANAQK